jgi:hypothetical protein
MLSSRQSAPRQFHPRPGWLVLPACLALLMAAVGGCRTTLLLPAAAPAAGLDEPFMGRSAAKPEPRTIPFDLVFVRFAERDPALTEDLWQLVDEQALDDDVRRRLAANGLRAGVVSATLPPALAARFTAATDPALDTGGQPSLIEAPAVVRRTMRMLPGRDNEVLAAGGLDELVLIECTDGCVQGTTYHDASAIFTLKAWPAANGRVRVEVCPVIKHGPMERNWVGDEGVFRLETGQKREVLDHLRFETTLAPESMLVLTAAGEMASSVGDAFCRDHGSSADGLRLVALRPLARARDPLFTPAEE